MARDWGDWTDEQNCADRSKADLVAGLVGMALNVPAADIVSPRRKESASFARHVSIYLAHVCFDLPLARAASAFGRDRTTGAHACKRVEAMRDDRSFDQAVARLEAVVRSAPGRGEFASFGA